MELSNTKRLIIYIMVIVLSILIFLLSQFVWYNDIANKDKIFIGVYISDLYVGGMTYDEAITAVDTRLHEMILDHSIIVVNDNVELPIVVGNVSDFDEDALVQKAFNIGRDDNSFKEYLNILKLKFVPQHLDTLAAVSYDKIYSILEENKDKFQIDAVNADIRDLVIDDNNVKVIVSPSSNGYEMDIAKTAEAVQDGLIDDLSHVFSVMRVLEPEITTEHMMSMASEPYVFRQAFALSEDSNMPFDFQEADINVAPIVLAPGETISIKKYIGYDFYEPYNLSVKNLHIPTVIYIAAAQVGLEIVEHHTAAEITPDMDIYSLGQEAVLDYNKDLVLKNNFSNPIVINLSYSRDYYAHQLVCSIYTAQKYNDTYLKSIINAKDLKYNVQVYRMYINDSGGFLYSEVIGEYSYPVPPEPIEIPEDEESTDDSNAA